ncbi:DedA family protein [Candidatus Hydrogenosomobacter endosymbioticus]|nr:DedA family protein [Candidatus Hydrogenosomobacter endosymbioticus]
MGFEFSQFVQQWGYIAVFLGSLIEGEGIILTASALAALGHLSIYKVMVIAFCGTVFADQSLYFVGYYYGDRIISYIKRKFPRMEKPMDRGLNFLHRHRIVYIMTFRFIYSIRIVSPIIIGAQRVPFKLFSFLNVIAAVVWTVTSCSLGYLIGETIVKRMDSFKKIFFGVVVGCVLAVFLLKLYKKRRSVMK